MLSTIKKDVFKPLKENRGLEFIYCIVKNGEGDDGLFILHLLNMGNKTIILFERVKVYLFFLEGLKVLLIVGFEGHSFKESLVLVL